MAGTGVTRPEQRLSCHLTNEGSKKEVDHFIIITSVTGSSVDRVRAGNAETVWESKAFRSLHGPSTNSRETLSDQHDFLRRARCLRIPLGMVRRF